MILEYHRPKTLEEALLLLARTNPPTVPLGGGTVLSQPAEEAFAVVDLQALGLNGLEAVGNNLRVGATTTLEALARWEGLPPVLAAAIQRETHGNIRRMATIAGTVTAADGRSVLLTALLALDAHLVWMPEAKEIALGDWLPLRAGQKPGQLITAVMIPLQASLNFEVVARSPADRPIVCTAVARWPMGRTRVALGGYGKAPVLVFDGPQADGVEIAVRDAYSQAGDAWASAEYRQEVAATLIRRLLA